LYSRVEKHVNDERFYVEGEIGRKGAGRASVEQTKETQKEKVKEPKKKKELKNEEKNHIKNEIDRERNDGKSIWHLHRPLNKNQRDKVC